MYQKWLEIYYKIYKDVSSVYENVYIGKLVDIVNEYNNTS